MGTREQLELGVSFEKNGQYDHACMAYAEVLKRLYEVPCEERRVARDEHLLTALELAQTASLLSEPLDLETEGLQPLQDIFDEEGFGRNGHVATLHNNITSTWNLVFLGHWKKSSYGEATTSSDQTEDQPMNEVEIGFTRSSRLFLLKLDGEEHITISSGVAAAPLFAFSYAHLGYARVQTMVQLYLVGNVLTDMGAQMIAEAGRFLRFAVLIHPRRKDNYSWALARCAETCRILANSWSSYFLHETVNRVNFYLRTMLYFSKAIEQNPRNYWAYAHMGAGVVDLRSFAPGLVLRPLEPTWSEMSEEGDEWNMLDLAILLFSRAQSLLGNYYPWAELFQGGAYFLKTFLDPPDAKTEDYAQLAFTYAIDANVMAPGLLRGSNEPTQVFNSSFIAVSFLLLKKDLV